MTEKDCRYFLLVASLSLTESSPFPGGKEEGGISADIETVGETERRQVHNSGNITSRSKQCAYCNCEKSETIFEPRTKMT